MKERKAPPTAPLEPLPTHFPALCHDTQSSCLTYCPLTPTRLASSRVSPEGWNYLASGLNNCYELEELE